MPERADFYAMQTAAEIRRTVARKPGDVDANSFLIQFRKKSAKTGLSIEQETMIQKAKWGCPQG
jgi:hypothetical protein